MSWLQNLKLPDMQIPLGGNSEVCYKHSAGENWACIISRLGAWDQDGPHRTCTYHIYHDSVGYDSVLAIFKKEWALPVY